MSCLRYPVLLTTNSRLAKLQKSHKTLYKYAHLGRVTEKMGRTCRQNWRVRISEDRTDRDRWRVLVNEVMNFRVPWNAGNFLTSWEPVSFSRRTKLHGVNKYMDLNRQTKNDGAKRRKWIVPQVHTLKCLILLPLASADSKLSNIQDKYRHWIA